MRRLFENKVLVLVLATILLLSFIILSAIPGSPLAGATKPLSFIVDPIQSVFQKIGTKLSDFYAAIADGMEIRKENEELKEEIAELEYKVQQGEEARIRWEELKSAFQIQDTFENYHIRGASVLTRESDEWFSVIRINVGTHSGIDTSTGSYAVVDARMNLVGRVMSTDLDSSKILPLLHEGFTVSAKVNEVNGATVIVSGDIILKNKGLCVVSRIPSNAVLKPGTELVTSGEGGLFPAGIPIGTIESFDDSDPDNLKATMRPYVSISDIKDVFIMVPNTEDDTESSESQQTSLPTPTTAVPPESVDPKESQAGSDPQESGEGAA
ncbi:MAG: rod shape-determining protein MreC [Clostridiales bacterium]|nr:rod shape-determining protein MreC [Clostridiales bacterium]